MNDSSYAWEDFSSDSSVDEENDVGRNKVIAKKKVSSIKQQKPKAQTKAIQTTKAKPQKKVNNVKFGVEGEHKYKGKRFKPSPKGAPMVLSRRLSRRITKASPLRSPIVAAKLVFSGKKTKTKKAWTK